MRPKSESAGADRVNPVARALRACRSHFVQAASFSALVNILYLAPALYMLSVYDRAVPTEGVTTLVLLTLMFVLAVAVLAALDWVRARMLIRASARLDRLLAGQIIDASLKSRPGENPSPFVMREFDTFRQALTGPAILALFDAPWAPIYIIVCTLLHPLLGLLALGGAVILGVLTFLNEKATAKRLQRANVAAAAAYSTLDASAAQGGVIKALGMRGAMVARHLRERRAPAVMQAEASFASVGFMAGTKAARMLLQSLAIGLGAYLAINHQIHAGAIFAASLLVSRALQPIEQITGAWKSVVQARGAYQSLKTMFERQGEEEERTALPPPTGRIDVERLVVASPERDRAILADVTFAVEAGDSIGIVGPSGSGKSTLVKALVGAIEPAAGAIRYDGAEIRDWPGEDLAQRLGYCSQEPSLFRGTIKQNIARFETELDKDPARIDAAVIEAAKVCGAHEFILRLPKGYDTDLGWNGAGLSVGQAQRIALARAFYGDPAVVVLDEPNAHLDAQGEALLIQALDALKKKGVTLITVAHRTGVLASVNKLMLVRNGRIELYGPKDEVLAQLNGARPPGPPGIGAAPPVPPRSSEAA